MVILIVKMKQTQSLKNKIRKMTKELNYQSLTYEKNEKDLNGTIKNIIYQK